MRAKIGRNDPCPCGSTKKFKKCHGSGNAVNIPLSAPVPSSPLGSSRAQIVATIERGVDEVRSLAARFATADVIAWCKEPLVSIGEQFGNALVSQYRQLAFLLSVLLETPEPAQPVVLTPEIWGREISAALNWLFLQYPVLDTDRRFTDDDEWSRSWVSKSTYLHYFNTGALATDVQLMKRIEGTLVPSDAELKTLCGVTATDATALYRAIVHDIVERDETTYARRLKQFASFSTPTAAITAAKHAFLRDDLTGVVSADALAAFWTLFFTRRGGVAQTTKYPTDPHHVEETPFIELDEGIAAFAVLGSALVAIENVLGDLLAKSPSRSMFLKRRDDFLEEEVVRVFSAFFAGSGAQLFPDAHVDEFQHDLLIVHGTRVVIVEAKAGAMKEPFRDLDRAWVRLKDNFADVVGDGHMQASRTRTRLLNCETIRFVTRKREPLVEISGGTVSEVFTVCVTADDFGPLTRDMSPLLKKNDGEIFPWAVMFNDLEAFLEAFPYLKVPHSAFYKFLRERVTLHGRVEFSDELELAGYFFKNGTLLTLDHGPGTRTQVNPRYSEIFDRIYEQKDEDL